MQLLAPEAYDQIFTMHGITMIFWYAVADPVRLRQLPDSADDRRRATWRYPRLNAFSYWMFLLSGVFLYASSVARAGAARRLVRLRALHATRVLARPQHGLLRAGADLPDHLDDRPARSISSSTILRLRAPGMSISRMPLFLYSTLTDLGRSIVLVAAGADRGAACSSNWIASWGTHFFDVARGGSALLWQQLFWFFGHPWVYIIFLPATGHDLDDHSGVRAPADRRATPMSRWRRC